LSFIHLASASSKLAPTRPLLSTLLYDILSDPALSSSSPASLLEMIEKAEVSEQGRSMAQTTGEVADAQAYWNTGARFTDGFGLGDGDLAIVINGRVRIILPLAIRAAEPNTIS
jgi:hypothetical protein